MAKTASSVGTSADRIKTDPERTRRKWQSFSRAGKAAKLLRTIFPGYNQACKSGQIVFLASSGHKKAPIVHRGCITQHLYNC
jgi:hypothetical protein